MLVDTHCHINMMVKTTFDIPLTKQNIEQARTIVDDALQMNVDRIINVGTSLIESINCIQLAHAYAQLFASVGIHPNDCTDTWRQDIKGIEKYLGDIENNKIVAIGEIGFDKHYPGYNLKRQMDAFKAQVELALKYNLPIIIHTREASQETLMALEEFKHDPLYGVVHCFSENLDFARDVIKRNLLIGIGGPLTYPNNTQLQDVCRNIPLEKIVLETDAPFLPPQIIRGKSNSPKYIHAVAEFLAKILEKPMQEIAKQTTQNAMALFKLD